MDNNTLRLEGEFTLKDLDKRLEMNELILQTLRKTGVGRLTSVEVAGEEIPVFAKAEIDENGIIKFDYSILENIKREGNYYDTNTCELSVADIGFNHFENTICMIMTVLAGYSETECTIMENNKPFKHIGIVALMVEATTGVRIEKISKYEPDKHILKNIFKLDSEDKFIGIWESEDIILSEKTKRNIEKYKKIYMEIRDEDVVGYETVNELVKRLSELRTIWNIDKYIDKDLLEEIIDNENNVCFKKAVMVLGKLIDEEVELFAELSETQIRKWILKRADKSEYASIYWQYLDLLSNKPRRREIFGY